MATVANGYQVRITKSLSWDASNMNAIIAGARGYGKTFLALSLVTSLASLPTYMTNTSLIGLSKLPTQIFVIDFKNADMARLGEILPQGRVATNKNEAIELINYFLELMQQRIDCINTQPFGSTAKSLQMPLYYLVIDEWAVTNAEFNNAITKEDKALKYRWNEAIHNLVMLGRLPGFGLIIITQQASVTNSGLSSSIAEQAGIKIHMGQANESSYRLTFGNEVKIPKVSLGIGEGFLWEEGLTDAGYVIPFAAPFVQNENIWQTLELALSEQDDSKYIEYMLSDKQERR